MKFDRSNLYHKLILTMFFVSVFFYSLLSYSIRMPIMFLSLLLVIALPVISQNWIIRNNAITTIWLATLGVVVINMMRSEIDRYYLFFYVAMILLLYLFQTPNVNTMEFAFNVIKCLGVFFALFTIIPVINLDFYANHIVGLLKENGNFNPLIYAQRGMYSGFTNQTAINATYLIMGIGAFFILAIDNTDSKNKIKYWVLIAIEMVCALLTSKRGPCVFAIIAMIIVYYFNSNRGKRITNIFKIFLLILGLLVLIYYFVPAANAVFTRMMDGSSDDFSNGRFVLYESAIQMFQKNKLFGTGWTTFRYAYTRYVDVHNVYLQLLCETGITGVVVFFIAFIATYVSTIKVLNTYKSLGTVQYKYMLFSLYLQTYILLYSLTGNALYNYYIFFFYFLAVLMLVVCKSQIRNEYYDG